MKSSLDVGHSRRSGITFWILGCQPMQRLSWFAFVYPNCTPLIKISSWKFAVDGGSCIIRLVFGSSTSVLVLVGSLANRRTAWNDGICRANKIVDTGMLGVSCFTSSYGLWLSGKDLWSGPIDTSSPFCVPSSDRRP